MTNSSQAPFQRGLSPVAVVLIGFIGGVALLICFLTVRFTISRFSPTRSNAERLLRGRKFDQALAVAQRMSAHTADLELLRGRIWLAKAWQNQDQIQWADYGRNDEDWFSSEEVQRAQNHFERALVLDPDCPDARYWLGVIYLEKGWFSEAEAQFRHVLNRNSRYTEARIRLAATYAASDRLAEARQELREALETDPTNPATVKNMAFLFRFHLNQPESAMVWFNRYLNLDPRADQDRRFVTQELLNLLERYPEFVLQEGQKWKRRSRF